MALPAPQTAGCLHDSVLHDLCPLCDHSPSDAVLSTCAGMEERGFEPSAPGSPSKQTAMQEFEARRRSQSIDRGTG